MGVDRREFGNAVATVADAEERNEDIDAADSVPLVAFLRG